MRHIKSMYWDNIDPKILAGQRAAVSALGYQVEQCNANGTPHGVWLDQTMEALAPDDSVLFLDIDCIPLTAAVIERAFTAAECGGIFGAAQTANHLPDKDFVYAGPMFLCVSKATWERLGRPTFKVDAQCDVGMRVGRVAVASGTPVELITPSFVCRPKWPLGRQGCSGIGTFYGGEIFHLFESRHDKGFRYAFYYVAGCVVSDQRIDYVALHAKMNSFSMNLGVARAKLVRELRRLVRVR